MLESFLGVADKAQDVDSKQIIGLVLFAIILGIILCASYILSVDREKRSLSFITTLVILPAVVTLVIALIGSNLAQAVSLGGVFALVRFRSAQGNGRDISYVFLSMAAGLATAIGMPTVALIATVVLSVLIILSSRLLKVFMDPVYAQLRIIIPEDMDYEGVFDDLFSSYTEKHDLLKVKTTNMGTLFELTYRIKLKKGVSQKKFMDELRKRNGNLTVTVAVEKDKEQDL